MKKNELYLTPEVDVLEIAVEEGFFGSVGQLPEYDDDDEVIEIG